MANEQNIIPHRFTSDQDRERARENGRRGGYASGRARRARKRMAEMATEMLGAPIPKGSRPYEEARALYPDLGDEDMTMQLTVLQGQLNAALKGDTRAAEFLLSLQDRSGGGGRDEAFTADFGLLIGPAFLGLHRSVAAGAVSDIWADGGRGSLKSSWASLEVAYGLARDPDANAVVMQARGVDIRDGTFSQMLWALEKLGVRDDWRAASSARRIVHRETGQLILFRGCDDASKTKGIKIGRGYVRFLWLEEVDQFRGMGELRTIRQSVARGEGPGVVRIHTFNPPLSKDSWANVEAERVAASDDPTEVRVRSSYLEAPAEWLGEQFIRDAEGLREADERAYRHEYLGEPVGVGGEVFPRLETAPISDAEVAGFERLYAGQDWGWWPDPWAFVLSAWDPSTRTLWSFKELGGTRIQPDESAEMVREALTWSDGGADEYHAVPVRTDDSAPSLIQAHRDAGVMAVRAEKGRRRMESYEWLASVRWVVDPVRCPNLAREARAKTYERTADGEWLSSIPDGDDHWIDAVRYSVMPIVTRRGAYGTDRRGKEG